MPNPIEAPYWTWDHQHQFASFLDDLIDNWPAFTAWVATLPDSFVRLKILAGSAQVEQRTELGRELLDAWKSFPDQKPSTRAAVESLADGIIWRVIQWARAHDFDPPPDPARLVLFEERTGPEE
jgi:hypothetical protein